MDAQKRSRYENQNYLYVFISFDFSYLNSLDFFKMSLLK